MAIASVATVASAQNKTSAATFTFSPSATLDANNLGVFVIAFNNILTTDGDGNDIFTISDSKNNTWNRAREFVNGQGSAAAGAACDIWWVKPYSSLLTSDTITVWFRDGTSVTAKAVSGWEFTIGAGDIVTVSGSADSAQDAATDWAALTVGSLSSAEYLWVRGGAEELNDATQWTGSAGFTNMTPNNTTSGGAASNIAVRGEFVVATGTTQTSDPTNTITAADLASTMVAFGQVVPGADAAVVPLPLDPAFYDNRLRM